MSLLANIQSALGAIGADIKALTSAITGKPDLGSTAPAALGTASAGSSTTAAHADHVHALPSSFPGAISIAGRASVGTGYSGNGPALTTGFTGSVFTVGSTSVAHIQIASTSNGAGINISRWSADAPGPALNIGKSRSSTIGTPGTAVLAGDYLAAINFSGDNGSSLKTSAGIAATAEENFSASASGVNLRFFTTANGSSTYREVARFSAGGALLVGTATNTAAGDKIVAAGSVSATGPIKPGGYTLTTLPSASAYSSYLIMVTNATGGPALCYSDGTNWLRVSDKTVVN